jgi:membrane-associated protease RseP (regulator of RpoE activity)
MKPTFRSAAWVAMVASIVYTSGFLAARAQNQEVSTVTVTATDNGTNADPAAPAPVVVTDTLGSGGVGGHGTVSFSGGGGGGAQFGFGSSSGSGKVIIQSIEPDGQGEPARDVTWLGVSVDESSEVLSSQLGLKTGEGLTVNFVAPASPAEKADFHKDDVLVELDGQMLMDPVQLRKLVEMHAEGDSVKLTFFRGGKQQTMEVKLGKRVAEERGIDVFTRTMPKLEFRMGDLNGKLRSVEDQLSHLGLDKGKMNAEIQRTLAQTVKAIQDSLSHATIDPTALSNAASQLQSLTHGGVDMDKDATVTVRSKHNSSRTIVKTDDDGTIVLVAGDKQHLTARDKDGQLLFDGDIDTKAEQEKVPKTVWEKVKPLLN